MNFGYVRKDNSNSVKSERRYEDEYIKTIILEKEGDNRGSVYLYLSRGFIGKHFGYSCFLSVFTLSGDENREI